MLTQLLRVVLNYKIYHMEYNHPLPVNHPTNAVYFQDNRKRNTWHRLLVMSFCTVFWMNYTRSENKINVIISNSLSFVFISIWLVVFIFDI